MFCPNCGNEVKDGAVFCSKCGTAVGVTTTSSSVSSTSPAIAQRKGFRWKPWIWISAAVVAVIILIITLPTFKVISLVKSEPILENEGYSEPLETILDKYVFKQHWSTTSQDGAKYVDCDGLLLDWEFLLTIRVTDLGNDQGFERVVGGSINGYRQDGDAMSNIIRALYEAYEDDIDWEDIEEYLRHWIVRGGVYPEWW